jgi:acetoin utilization protein AcuB
MTPVRSVMTAWPHTIASTTPIRAALVTLAVEHIRHLPVVDDGALVGIVSDRDLRAWRQALLDEAGGEENPLAQAALDAPVSKLMTYDVTTVGPETPVRDAVAELLRDRVGALPVVDDGEVVGIVSTIDLLELLRELLDAEPDLVA